MEFHDYIFGMFENGSDVDEVTNILRKEGIKSVIMVWIRHSENDKEYQKTFTAVFSSEHEHEEQDDEYVKVIGKMYSKDNVGTFTHYFNTYPDDRRIYVESMPLEAALSILHHFVKFSEEQGEHNFSVHAIKMSGLELK